MGKTKKLTIKYESAIQYNTIIALVESFQEDSINIDKFIMWCYKNYNTDNSVCVKVLKSLDAI